MKGENILQGEWIVICSEIYGSSGWEPYQLFDNDSLQWSFILDEEFPTEFKGWLIERSEGQKDSETICMYHPENKLLTIDRSNYLDDGFCDTCEEEQYAIEPADESSQEKPLLYFSLQNEYDCPSPYFRYLLQKLSR